MRKGFGSFTPPVFWILAQIFIFVHCFLKNFFNSSPCIDIGVFLKGFDKFKKVNDEYGHHVGDMLLKHLGEVLSDIIRDKDTIAILGGDEFVILFEHLESLEYLNLTLKRIE